MSSLLFVFVLSLVFVFCAYTHTFYCTAYACEFAICSDFGGDGNGEYIGVCMGKANILLYMADVTHGAARTRIESRRAEQKGGTERTAQLASTNWTSRFPIAPPSGRFRRLRRARFYLCISPGGLELSHSLSLRLTHSPVISLALRRTAAMWLTAKSVRTGDKLEFN